MKRAGTTNGDAIFLESYVDSGLIKAFARHGLTDVLLAPGNPCAPEAQNSSSGGHNITLRAEETVRFVDELVRRHGVHVSATGVANEPGCWVFFRNTSGQRVMASWPSQPDLSGNVVTAVRLQLIPPSTRACRVVIQ